MIEYLDSRDGVVYGDLVDDFDDYVGYLAAREGPTSQIDMSDMSVEVTEADIAIASHLGRKVEEAENIDWRTFLEGTGETVGTLAFTGQFLRSGDPAWLSTAVVLGYLSKEDAVETYKELRNSWRARNKKEESVSGFRKDYPEIDMYDVRLEEIDEDASVSSVRPEEIEGELEDVIEPQAQDQEFRGR